MNERIRELALQAGFKTDRLGHLFGGDDIEKFAELIVQETIKQMAIQMDKFGDDQSNNPAWYKSEEAVKKHFGVEESLSWVCSKCGTDRTKAVCPLGNSAAIDGRCPMVLTTK